MWKLDKLSSPITARFEKLCWGPHTARRMSKPQSLLSVTYHDDKPIILAISHVYEPVSPAEDVIAQVIAHSIERQVRQVNWSKDWRHLKPKTNPERYEHVFPKEIKSKDEVDNAILRAGAEFGLIGKRSEYEIMSNLEQIINGNGKF